MHFGEGLSKVEDLADELHLAGVARRHEDVHGEHAAVEEEHCLLAHVVEAAHPDDRQLENSCIWIKIVSVFHCIPSDSYIPKGKPFHLLTSFQQDNLVVLREAHETRYHLCELDDLRDDRRQLLRRLHPQVMLTSVPSHTEVTLSRNRKDFIKIVFLERTVESTQRKNASQAQFFLLRIFLL